MIARLHSVTVEALLLHLTAGQLHQLPAKGSKDSAQGWACRGPSAAAGGVFVWGGHCALDTPDQALVAAAESSARAAADGTTATVTATLCIELRPRFLWQ